MNERIKELIAQATIPVIETNDYNGMAYETYQFSQEKFAELIIKECEKVILAKLAVTDIDDEVERAWEMGMECGVYTIKEHFGVQE